ncbi:hypothetical protein NQZ79_g1027 [Umbelopsis isabellina]|nr:hypothetical protein NQZ79_g1027 [Umbelopsis isabellina]
MTETGIQRPQRNSIRFEEGDMGTLASIDGSTMNDVPYTTSRRRSIDAHLRRKILIAYDNSEFSQKMFEWSLAQILRPDSDHILLATVLDVQESTYFHRNWGGDRNAVPGFRGSARRLSISESDQATAQLKPLVERLVQRGMTAQINVLKGDAKQEIVKISKDLGADMIIIGSRGLGAVKRLTMGSVSDLVVVRETALDMTLNRSMSRRQSQ